MTCRSVRGQCVGCSASSTVVCACSLGHVDVLIRFDVGSSSAAVELVLKAAYRDLAVDCVGCPHRHHCGQGDEGLEDR